MASLRMDYDISTNRNVELYLFWVNQGNQVDVAIYVHNVPKNQYADLKSEFEQLGGADRNYRFAFEPDMDHPIPEEHTEYYEYSIEGPPQEIISEIVPQGTSSRANAVAL